MHLNRRDFLLISTAALAGSTPLPGVAQTGDQATLPLERFGGSARRGLDNGPALRRAFAAANGATITLGQGVYEVAAEGLLREDAIRRPPGVALAGAGRARTTLQVTGASVINQLFTAHDSSAVLTRDMRIVGNGIKSEQAPYAGGLMSAFLTPSARGDLTGIVFRDCDIENFASATWFHAVNQSPRYRIRGCGSSGCNWQSRPGTCPHAGDIGVPGHFIYFDGDRGAIEETRVDDLTMEARYVKGGVGLVGNIDGGTVHVARLLNAGRDLGAAPGPDGAGAYAVLLYQKPGRAPRNLTILIDRLENAVSVGIYAAGARSSRFHIRYGSGQRDTRDDSIYKGVLVLNACRDIDAQIDLVEDCNRVLMIATSGGQNLSTGMEDARIAVRLAEVRSRAGARDITIGTGGSAWSGGIRISGRRSGPAAIAFQIRGAEPFGLQDVDLSELISTGAQQPIAVAGRSRPRLRRIRLPGGGSENSLR